MKKILKEVKVDTNQFSSISSAELAEVMLTIERLSEIRTEYMQSLSEKEIKEVYDYISDQRPYPKYLTVKEVSELLNLPPQMVCRHCANGQIKGHQTLGNKGKWKIDSSQFIQHANWHSIIDKYNNTKKNSDNFAKKMLDLLEH